MPIDALSTSGIAFADQVEVESSGSYSAEWLLPSAGDVSRTIDDVGSNEGSSSEHQTFVPPGQRGTIGGMKLNRAFTNPVRFKNSIVSIRRFVVLQQWEGVVLEVAGGTFTAQLHDLTNPTNPIEFAEIPIEGNVAPSDLELLRPGGVFYWALGYEIRLPCQVVNASQIRFRRVAPWNASAMKRLKCRADILAAQFSSCDENPAPPG
jgi:hypothetical protein